MTLPVPARATVMVRGILDRSLTTVACTPSIIIEQAPLLTLSGLLN